MFATARRHIRAPFNVDFADYEEKCAPPTPSPRSQHHAAGYRWSWTRAFNRRRVVLAALAIQAIGTVIYFQEFLLSHDELSVNDDFGIAPQHGSTRELRAIAFDRGGWNAIEPVLSLALIEGVGVRVFLGGASARHFQQGLLRADSRLIVTNALEDWNDAAVQSAVQEFVQVEHGGLLVAASQSAEGTRGAVHAICTSAAHAVLVEDMYGTSVNILAQISVECPSAANATLVTVGDKIGHGLVKSRARKFPGVTLLTGAPQFDAVAEWIPDLPRRRASLRSHLGLEEREILLLIAGQPRGTHEMLTLVKEAAFDTGARVRVLLRPHPRTPESERRLEREIRSQVAAAFFVEADRAEYPTSVDLLPAADVVMSGFSTTNYFAILLGIRGVVYAGTPSLLEDLSSEKGVSRPPEADAGAGWFVQTAEELQRVLAEVRATPESEAMQKVRLAQEGLSAGVDGQAAKRVW
eukprot:CAMPEP_0118953134 /NCGR_PEP_ID=MMETSP1169-20130426/56028_1 /TAXON_ID=36882 /ORGANISM="Pyramimonas obovata, Strain CCMP722" /LENGTH=465 /DNA_ID=CAMNT_0006900517 /DNA_START=170 /DNA_END=1564 /DNA_ORIENTATION=+